MCVCVCVCKINSKSVGVSYWAPQSLVPGGRNTAITPLAKEGGRQKAREGCGEGRDGGRNTADLANNSK